VGRITRQPFELPAHRVVARRVLLDVPRAATPETIGQVYRALAAVLRRPDLDDTAVAPLYLPREGQRATQEVDISGDLTRTPGELAT
jgi:hypothetical protein